MLHGYPVYATADNWLHENIQAILYNIYLDVSSGKVPKRWPNCLPNPCRDTLRAKTGLKTRLFKYIEAFKHLTQSDRDRVQEAVVCQNKIEALLSNTESCATTNELPSSIQAPLRELYAFCFTLLTELGIRDEQYRIIWESSTQHICPFCGIETFDSPTAPREDLDHFLAQSIYPCAAINLKNLVPMGKKCNQQYKGILDVLRSPDGNRRRVFNPYHHGTISISLKDSIPFAGARGQIPRWCVDLQPASEECETWDVIFSVRERYVRDILDPFFIEWLRAMASWWSREVPSIVLSDEEFLREMARYIGVVVSMKLTGRDFLRVPTFEMLYTKCLQGNARLIKLLRSVVSCHG